MKLYRTKISEIANGVIRKLNDDGHIEVSPDNRLESEMDLVAIMEEYLKRDRMLRETVRERMAALSIPYDAYPKIRRQLATEWNHPVGQNVERYLSNQFIESFFLSKFVDEVYSENRSIRNIILEILESFNVDEGELRDEAREQVKNIPENTVEYEIRFNQALRDVRVRHGLIEKSPFR
jgi:hypothetical protein